MMSEAPRFKLGPALYILALFSAGFMVDYLAETEGTFCFGTIFVLLYWVFVDDDEQSLRKAIWGGLMVLVFVCCGSLAPPVGRGRSHHAPRDMPVRRFRGVTQATLVYQYLNGVLPSAWTAGPQGEKFSSWRVALLPFVERIEVSEQFRRKEPWNSEHNLRFAKDKVWNQPAQPSIILGDHTAWPKEGGPPRVVDGNTVLFVERIRTLPWSAPDDPTFEEFLAENRDPSRIPKQPIQRTFFYEEGEARFLGFADGSVGVLEIEPTPEQWKAILDPARGRKAFEQLPQPTSGPRRFRWETVIPLFTYIALAGLPTVRLLRGQPKRTPPASQEAEV